MLAWFAPALVGGGDAITQSTLTGADALAIVPLIFLVRFALSTVCYAARTPGGLFAPLLVPTVLKGAPIYESLRAGIMRQAGTGPSSPNSSWRDSGIPKPRH
jgi:H+/Cl- antiporter ClcA